MLFKKTFIKKVQHFSEISASEKKAGFFKQNKGSKNVLIKNYFKKEGVFKSELQFQNKRSDHIFYGKII